MLVAEDIFADVDSEVILLNGEVVRRAFNPILDEPVPCSQCGRFGETKCPMCLGIICSACEHAGQHRCKPVLCSCQYWTEPSKFSRLLNEYVQAKEIAESAQMRMLDPLTQKEKQDGIVWLIRSNRFTYEMECSNRRDELRAKLKAIWPCSQCMDKYHPTGRRRPWLM